MRCSYQRHRPFRSYLESHYQPGEYGNGQGHKVTNIKISESATDYIGLFGKVSNGGTVKNLIVADSSWDFSARTKYLHGISGVAGNVYNSYLLNCGSTVSINAANTQNNQGVGCLAGTVSIPALPTAPKAISLPTNGKSAA